ncbi:MAG TPA: matrixin family metalloprotease [Thermoanaerobaculia bacterium]|nr:matrixin family metalloprotease [Thermoanaerobaculia bacterium]
MKKQTIFALAIVTAILAASAHPAMAYTLLSPTRRWKTTPVTVLVNSAGNSTITDSDKGVTAVAGAIKAWNIISSGSTSNTAVRGTAPSIIMLNTNGNVCTGSCLAATLTGYYHTEGSATYIDDADIYTNTRYDYTSSREADGCSGEYDIDGIMTHEVGHVIGLGHSTVAGATMYPSVSACNFANRTLDADDIAGRKALYGK